MKTAYKNYEDFQIKSFMLIHTINTNTATNSYMVEWIQVINEMKSNKIKYKGKRIKEFLVRKRKSKRNYRKFEKQRQKLNTFVCL